jgi:superfamily II DNA or RNA helicase
MNSTLRPDQEHALELLRQSLRAGNKRPMMQAPTGFGKTMLAAAICDGILKRGKQAIMTVPAITLVDQTVDKFAKEGITDVGVIQPQHTLTNSFAPIQVASIDTLCRRPLPKADYVLIDEAHRLHKFYGEWMTQDEWRKIPFIGLSATPWTKGLGRLYDDLLIPTSTQKLIDAGHLSQFRVFRSRPSRPLGCSDHCWRLPRGRAFERDAEGRDYRRHRQHVEREGREPADHGVRRRSRARPANPKSVSGCRHHDGLHRRLHAARRSQSARPTIRQRLSR